MKVTPSDLLHQTFKVRVRGFDRDEVRAFLNFVSEEYETLIGESARLREEHGRLKERLADYEERERILKDTLISAQKVADEMKTNASKEAALIIREAELRAEVVIEQASGRLRKLQEEATELRLLRTNLEQKLLLYVSNLQKLIEIHRQEEGTADDRLALFTRGLKREKA